MKIRLAVAGVALAVWAYGYTADSARIRMVGIVLLFASLMLRFADRQRRRDDSSSTN